MPASQVRAEGDRAGLLNVFEHVESKITQNINRERSPSAWWGFAGQQMPTVAEPGTCDTLLAQLPHYCRDTVFEQLTNKIPHL
jgi:hypothetical protein